MKLSDSSCDLKHTESIDTLQTFGSHQTSLSLCTTVTTVFEATALLKFRWIPAQAALSADFTGRESGGQKVPLFFFREGCSPSPRFYSHLPIICKDTRENTFGSTCFT